MNLRCKLKTCCQQQQVQRMFTLIFPRQAFYNGDVFCLQSSFPDSLLFLGSVVLLQRGCRSLSMERTVKWLREDSLPGGARAFSGAPAAKLCIGCEAADVKAGTEPSDFPKGTGT